MPSLIVQLDEAARETDIRFVKIATGQRAATPVAPAPPAAGTPPPASESGGEPATTGPGTAVETANEGAADANADAGAPPADASGAPTTGPAPTSAAPGLESVPLDFSFEGSFFDLADFFHEMKRFVRLAGGKVAVNGRLMTIDGFTFSSEDFPTIDAEVQASAYLSPKAEGTSAGGTAAGPAGAPADSAPATPAPAEPAAPPLPAQSTEVTQ